MRRKSSSSESSTSTAGRPSPQSPAPRRHAAAPSTFAGASVHRPREGRKHVMSSESDRRQGNAFTVEFLQRLDEIGEPDGAHEADVAGPWTIRPVLYRGATGFAVLREWESLENGDGDGAGDVPYAVFGRREVALLAAGVGSLPAAAGHLRDFDEALAGALHLAAALVRSPVALAWLLEAAGHVALEQAGRILDRRVR